MDFTKAERKLLRDLAAKTYEAEARYILEELDAEFKRWRAGELLASEMLDAVNEFHRERSRGLAGSYRSLNDRLIVQRGLGVGLLAESDVPPELRAKLNPWIGLPDYPGTDGGG